MVNLIEARGVSCELGGLRVLDQLHFEVKKGQCLGIAGAAGAGKTTLLRLIAGMTLPSAGDLFVLDLNARVAAAEIRARVGLLPDRDGFESELRALDSIVCHGYLFGISRRRLLARGRDLLRQVELDESEQTPVGSLGRAQIRRLALARALINDPEILLIDSPARDLGGAERRRMWRLIADQVQRGRTIIIASREMDELERICDRVVILDRGAVACQGQPANLIRHHIGANVVEYQVDEQDLEYHLRALGGAYHYQLIQDRLRIFLPETVDTATAFRWVPSERIVFRRARLQDVYVKLLGHEGATP